MIVGSIVLLALRKTIIDKETSTPTEIDLPMFGKIRVNSPALVLFGMGIVPLMYAVWDYHKLRERVAEQVSIVGTVTTDSPEVRIYAVQAVESLENVSSPATVERKFRLVVPLVGQYDVYYVAQDVVQNGSPLVVIDHKSVDLAHKQAGEVIDVDEYVLPSLSEVHLLPRPSEAVRFATNVAATPRPGHGK
jgi:hypothetical protein